MTTHDFGAEIRRFASEHPEGWNHDHWTGFLQDLSEKGHDVSDGDAVGLALESEHLSQVLRRMNLKGLGPKRIDSLAGHFGTLWNLKSASPEDLAQLPSVPLSMAEKILGDLR